MTSIRADFDVEMQTRDGVTLRSDVFRPDGPGRWPAIVHRTPYGKTGAHAHIASVPATLAAQNGYAFVAQDVRGRYGSEGEYTMLGTSESLDGYDCVEWVASQPWCDGNVGMIGGSYASYTQFAAASQRPPSLRAIVPQRTGGTGHRGGLPLDSMMITWAANQAMDWASKQPDLAAEHREVIRKGVFEPRSLAWHLPLEDMPLFRIPGLVDMDGFLQTFARAVPAIDYENIEVPALLSSGWYDIDPGGTCLIFSRLKDARMILGPWSHEGVLFSVGEWFFGHHAGAAAVVLPRYMQWYAKYLKGADVPAGPRVAYFEMGTNTWREADEWPPPGSSPKPMYLRAGGALSWNAPGAEGADSYEYDPMNPVPSHGGHFYSIGGSIGGPLEQTRIEKRDDVLVYTSEPQTEPLRIAGFVDVPVHFSTSAPDTDIVVKLCDVSPDGVSVNVANGMVRARYRDGRDKESLLVPGERYEITVDLGPVAHCFRPGHCVRVQIASSCFPAFDRNMNTGHPIGVDAEGPVAKQTVHHQSGAASHVLLPVWT